MPRKKKKLESVHQTHAKDEEAAKFVPQTLEQIWGDDGSSKYGTMDTEQYEEFLMNCSRAELHRHAVKVGGIVPIDNLSLMRDKLLKEFRKHVNSFKAPPVTKKPHKVSKEVQTILDEGK